jgi:hypothetical protein
MGTISLQVPTVGQPDTTEDVKVANNFTTIQTVINGNLDTTNLAPAVSQSAGVNASGQTVKGATIIATSQNTGSASYTTLTTPDQVTGIVLPSPGLLTVAYQATWQESVSGAGRAAIFIGANQLRTAQANSSAVQEATIGGTAGLAVPLFTTGFGMSSPGTNAGYSGDVTTGQIIGSTTGAGGGPVTVFAAAGTYTISVQFKASSGSVTVSNRRLYVLSLSFA